MILNFCRTKCTIIVFATMLALGFSSCKWFKRDQPTYEKAKNKTEKNGWINWNILFSPGTNVHQRNAQIQTIKNTIEQQLNDTIIARGISGNVTFKVDSCICDTLLYLLNADIKLWGTTGSNTTPPKTDPGASGGPGALVDDNDVVSLPDSRELSVDTTKKEFSRGKKNPLRLAILDTGIDTTLFQPNLIRSLFWDNPNTTINNFLIGANPRNFKDDNRGKHGSSAAALILRQSKQQLPSLMILKVLDRDGRGSVFTLSCALSYAAQNNAKVVNASLGYYGKPDEILRHYINKNVDTGHYVVAAAGNVAGFHDQAALCRSSLNSNGHLDHKHLFFPACYFNEGNPKNLFTVTGISSLTTSCFYQNHSSTYVSLGVMNRDNCCFYDLTFVNGIEGSSFATPVVAGKIANFLMAPGIGIPDVYSGIQTQTGATNLTFNGRFVKE